MTTASPSSATPAARDGPSAGVPRPEGAVGLKWYTVDKPEWTPSDIASPPNHGPRIAGLAEPLADFLHGKRDPICTAEEGRMSLRMLLASYISSRDGRRVCLCDPEIDAIPEMGLGEACCVGNVGVEGTPVVISGVVHGNVSVQFNRFDSRKQRKH